MNGWELAALLLAWGLGGGSPGPATLTISGTAMARGRIAGVVPGFGIVCGSAFWGGASALGMAAVMLTNAWLSIALKYIGALYLGYLALKSFRSAWQGNAAKEQAALNGSLKRVFAKSSGDPPDQSESDPWVGCDLRDCLATRSSDVGVAAHVRPAYLRFKRCVHWLRHSVL